MPERAEKPYKQRLFRSIAVFSVIFIGLLGLVMILLNVYFPDILLNRYIRKSRLLAGRISQSIEEIGVFRRQDSLFRKIIRVDFPDDENILHIIVRDKKGRTMYEERGQGEGGLSFSEMLRRREGIIEENLMDGNLHLLRGDKQTNSAVYYKISAPIFRDGERIGDVIVGLSRSILFNKIELTRGQIYQMAFIGSMGLVAILSLSFFINLSLFIKFKRSEERARDLHRLAYIGELSSGLAHEIRNPLNTLSINLQMLKEALPKRRSAQLEKKIRMIETAKDHAANVLNRFLDFARYRTPNRSEFDMLQTVRGVLQLLEERFRTKKITVHLESEKEACRIKADQNEMRQILLNLLINSIDALESVRKREITLRLATGKQGLVLAVRDTGIGMDEFTIRNIYAPFFSKKAHGTGLGLAVVKRIVDEYDGEIECRSTPGKGAEFEIKLPGVLLG